MLLSRSSACDGVIDYQDNNSTHDSHETAGKNKRSIRNAVGSDRAMMVRRKSSKAMPSRFLAELPYLTDSLSRAGLLLRCRLSYLSDLLRSANMPHGICKNGFLI